MMCWDVLLSGSEMVGKYCSFLSSFPIPKTLVANAYPAQSIQLIVFDC